MSIGHFVDMNHYDTETWMDLIKLAQDIIQYPKEYEDRCKGRILVTLFYEPSTRTKFSFQAAMLRLGGSVIGFDDPNNSSVSKGESLKDTILMVCNYSDIAVIRHPLEGTAAAAAVYATKPIINAGDGGHLHPTQTLADILTIYECKKKMTGLTIGICGDLKYGRTAHSLVMALSQFKGNRFVFISTEALAMPEYIIRLLEGDHIEYKNMASLQEAIPFCDVIYMTRIQKERFSDMNEYFSQKGLFILDTEKLQLARDDLLIMHPLPRADEITEDVDYDKRAMYFKQAEFGMYMRMALILRMLENRPIIPQRVHSDSNLRCTNVKCISNAELYLPKLTNTNNSGAVRCGYCDSIL